LPAKRFGEFHVLADFAIIGPLEDVVLLQLPATWELAAFFCNRFHFVDEFLLLLKQ
jgi:hypothetical protein